MKLTEDNEMLIMHFFILLFFLLSRLLCLLNPDDSKPVNKPSEERIEIN